MYIQIRFRFKIEIARHTEPHNLSSHQRTGRTDRTKRSNGVGCVPSEHYIIDRRHTYIEQLWRAQRMCAGDGKPETL